MVSGRELRRRVNAQADSLVDARCALTEWALAVGMPTNQRGDLVLAAYEAMANAAEHAYRGQGGIIELHARATAGGVVVTVVDHGVWRPPPDHKGIRGRGIPLIEGLSHRSTVMPGEEGTTVVMTWAAPDP
ncbi:ATP-binding protein [Actinophytocola sp.]|uniref:ATP-binding protein n=1 Tax=Actinophytocola sp. TaxID=1872138 RepID=UPI003899AD15